MTKLNKKSTVIVMAAFFVLGLAGLAIAATSVNLGTADNFAVLAGSTITNTGASVVNGDLGLNPGSSVTGFLPGIVNGTQYVANAVAIQAQSDLTTAYNVAAGTPCTQDLTGQDLGGLTLTPGVYCFDTSAQLTGTLVLDAQNNADAVFIFRIGSTLTTANGAVVSLINETQSCNVFWQVGSSATLGGNTDFKGNILALTSITLNTGANIEGRLLARNGAVTLDTNVVTRAICTVVPVTPTPVFSSGGSGYDPRIVPLIGLIKVPNPLALSTGSGKVTYNYTVWNIAGQQSLVNVSLVDDKCSPLTLVSGDINNDNKLDIGEHWKYSCSATLTSTTTNTAVATGYSDDSYHQSTIATAIATVVVSSPSVVVAPLPAPLISIVKVPSRLNAFPYGGGNVTYTYAVTNPGVVAMHDVVVTDDKCSPVIRLSGDTNSNDLLDINETWNYFCQSNIKVTTSNIAKAEGQANGFTAQGYAYATVLVATPTLPKTGVTTSPKDIVIFAGLMLLSVPLIMILRRRTV